jgi:hypothetical protein
MERWTLIGQSLTPETNSCHSVGFGASCLLRPDLHIPPLDNTHHRGALEHFQLFSVRRLERIG